MQFALGRLISLFLVKDGPERLAVFFFFARFPEIGRRFSGTQFAGCGVHFLLGPGVGAKIDTIAIAKHLPSSSVS